MIQPLTFLKGAGLGAGMMYFFDPVAGNRRRAQIRDQITNACLVGTDASNRLQDATAEIRSALESSDKPLVDRVQEGVVNMGHTLGAPSTWSPSAKAAAMIGGAGLIASFMNKRDLAAIAFGIVGLSFVAKELADQEQMRAGGHQQLPEGNQAANKKTLYPEKHQKGGHSASKQSGYRSCETSEGVGSQASEPTGINPAYDPRSSGR